MALSWYNNKIMDLMYARQVLKTEIKAIQSLIKRLGQNFKKAVSLILSCKGRIVVMGMGKVGIIGEKISATLASTGTPSLFLHPAEAYHGDLGRLVGHDIVLILSNSGETEEIIRLLPALKKIGVRLIAITASARSRLGRFSDLALEIGKITEACPWGLVPTASTTAILALGDALALTVFRHRKLTKEQYAFYHPGGELGRKLLKVSDVMRIGKRNPIVKEYQLVKNALTAITKKRAGAVSVVNKRGKLVGIFTDGDLRRSLIKDPEVIKRALSFVMTRKPTVISPDVLATEALPILKRKRIDELPVVDKKHLPVGMLDIQDLLEVGLI